MRSHESTTVETSLFLLTVALISDKVRVGTEEGGAQLSKG